jgi:hypothetical protein
MTPSPPKVEPESLVALATEAIRLLIAGDLLALADRFGYAIALGRHASTAIHEDLSASLASLGEEYLDQDAKPTLEIKYLKPEAQFYAVAECMLATKNGHHVIVELVFSVTGTELHATLEQISAAA